MANKGSFRKGEKKQNQGKRGPSKLTRTVKEAFERVFHDMQRDPKSPSSLGQWAIAEPTEFYKIAAKLIPTDIKASVSGSITFPKLEVVAAPLGIIGGGGGTRGGGGGQGISPARAGGPGGSGGCIQVTIPPEEGKK